MFSLTSDQIAEVIALEAVETSKAAVNADRAGIPPALVDYSFEQGRLTISYMVRALGRKMQEINPLFDVEAFTLLTDQKIVAKIDAECDCPKCVSKRQ